MILNVVVDDQTYNINVDEDILNGASELFEKMDNDMANGWQMGRDWVAEPGVKERCQIVADKLLTALENENQNMATMMAAYILKRMPGVQEVHVDIGGDMLNTELVMGSSSF